MFQRCVDAPHMNEVAMIGQDFRDTGWTCVPGRVAPQRYQVFGERCSGTNFVKRLIGRNSTLQPIEGLGWKHGFPHMTAIPSRVAVVCVVREARNWAKSMHAKPWHCPPDMQQLSFSDFIRAPWATIADRKRYFPQVAEHGGVGQALQLDREPVTGRMFENLFELRQAKLCGLLSFFERECTLVFCRLEAVQSDPEGFLDQLHSTLGVRPGQEPFRPVLKRLGAKFLSSVDARPPTPDVMSQSDLTYLRERISEPQETLLGYTYGTGSGHQ